MSFLSHLFAHHGVFQETLYYAQQAHKLVQEVGSDGHLAIASAYLGSVWLKAGRLDKGSELLVTAKRQGISGNKNPDVAVLAYYLGRMHGLLGDHEAEFAAYENAEKTLQTISGADFINKIDRVDPADDFEQRMASLAISKTKTAAPRKVGARPRTVVGKKTTTRAKTPVESTSAVDEECPQLMSLKGNVLRQKARALTSMKKFTDAIAILNETGSYSNTQIAAVEQGLAMAKQLLLQSIEQMHEDPVYSVLQESTISFPSIVGQFAPDRNSGDRLSVSRTSPPPRKTPAGKGRRDLTRSKSPMPNSFFEKLRQAQEHLIEIHSMALSAAPTSVVHNIAAVLNNVAILLSASGQIKGKPHAHPGFASCSIGKFYHTLEIWLECLPLRRNGEISRHSSRA
jgi:separase